MNVRRQNIAKQKGAETVEGGNNRAQLQQYDLPPGENYRDHGASVTDKSSGPSH